MVPGADVPEPHVIGAISDAEPIYDKTVFLAGGITGCPDWQAELIDKLAGLAVTLYNPRRPNFPIHDPGASQAQVKWEYERLVRADIVSFWFCAETLCPIVLFELGASMERPKRVVVGMDPKYPRRQDVEIQVGLRRPGTIIVYSLDELAARVQAEVQGSSK